MTGPGLRALRAGAALAAAMLALAGCSADAEPPAASQAYFPVGRCVNLANALNAPNEGEWGYRIEEDHLRRIANAGFDSVRVLIDWHSHAGAEAPYTVDAAYFERIDEVIGQSLSYGLAVIIDMHDYLGLYDDPAAHGPRAVAIWRQIAARYADYPPELIFEPVNEPREALSGETWEALAGELVAAIRETNPVRTIVLGGDNWSSLYGLKRLNLPDDPYLVATFHYYEPHDFTHQGATWYDDAPPAGATWGGAEARAAVGEHLEEARRWGETHRTPVFLGEFGVHNPAGMASRADWTDAVRRASEAGGMPWCYFDFAAGFEVWDPETETWVQPLVDALGMGSGEAMLRRNPDSGPALRR